MTDRPTDRPGIFKAREGVLINKDSDALMAYKKQRLKNRKIDEMEKDLGQLKTDILEIKLMLKELLK